ncbi:unnamed protein product, partial [marine sediment metagenome]
FQFYYHKGSKNLKAERAGYKFQRDKDGNVLEMQVKKKDDLMDAKRYGVNRALTANRYEL